MGEADTKPDGLSTMDALLATLRGYLSVKTSLSEPHGMTFDQRLGLRPGPQEGVEASITARNCAPALFGKGLVVFVGVGLRVVDARQDEGASSRLSVGVRKSRSATGEHLRARFSAGVWSEGSNNEFPAVTADEGTHGEVLFPGEEVVYSLEIPTAALPYVDISVEGTVSRRHLFHVVQPISAFSALAMPLLAQTFSHLQELDTARVLAEAHGGIPSGGPSTTLADLGRAKACLEEAGKQLSAISNGINEVYRGAPRREIRDYLNRVVGPHVRAAQATCAAAFEALSRADPNQITAAKARLAEEMRRAGEIQGATAQLMRALGVQ